jgi:hypothetical protein
MGQYRKRPVPESVSKNIWPGLNIDSTFSIILSTMMCAGYGHLLDHIAITNYIEAVLVKWNDDPTPQQIEDSKVAFETRLTSLRPKVILSLVGSDSGLQENVEKAADPIPCVSSVHPGRVRRDPKNFAKLFEDCKTAFGKL